MKDDPYNDFKRIHKASLINPRGGVSPLCAKVPKAINLKRESWTLNDADVDCPKCLVALGVEDPIGEAGRRHHKRIMATAEEIP